MCLAIRKLVWGLITYEISTSINVSYNLQEQLWDARKKFILHGPSSYSLISVVPFYLTGEFFSIAFLNPL